MPLQQPQPSVSAAASEPRAASPASDSAQRPEAGVGGIPAGITRPPFLCQELTSLVFYYGLSLRNFAPQAYGNWGEGGGGSTALGDPPLQLPGAAGGAPLHK